MAEKSRKIAGVKTWLDGKNLDFLSSYRGVAVACSGGPDSTALFLEISQLLKRQKNFGQLAVAHVNYGLRGDESDGDERFCRALAAGHGGLYFGRLVTAAERQARTGESVQEWARRLRRRLFFDLAADGWLLALAHHADDAAENALLRLARGTSPGKMVGMLELEPPFWRPLLRCSKADLAALLAFYGLTARYDASNAKMDYGRNVVRLRILPELEQLYPGAAERLVACARDAEDVVSWCSTMLRRELQHHRGRECAWLASLPAGVARQAIAELIEAAAAATAAAAAAARGRPLSRRTLDAALMLAAQGSGRLELPGGGHLVARQGALRCEADGASAAAGGPPPRHAKALAGDEGGSGGVLLPEGGRAVFHAGALSGEYFRR